MDNIYEKSLRLNSIIKSREYTIPVELKVTGDKLESIIISAIEGGISYWADIKTSTEEFKELEGSGLALSEKVFSILYNKKSVILLIENDEELELTMDKLLEGIKLNYKERHFDSNLNNLDATTADCIFQYAVFGKLIYD